MDDYRDDMRSLHRQQRDLARLHHDMTRIYTNPWSEHLRRLAEIRSFNNQMAHLDQQKAVENLSYHRPFGLFW